MKMLENSKIKENVFIEELDNKLKVIIIPKKDTIKKYVIWGTHFGSVDNHFLVPGKTGDTIIPDGVAHFLEHKMFEQKSGRNSLDTLMALGVEANAYTTNDHTAYLFECNDHFYEALDELMDYVQNPYFTDENVEKEKGIIAQEINMYDDDPGWQVYINAMDCLYENNNVKLDIAGTVESISKIDKEMLYDCYNTFYNPSNMVLVLCGDFEPEAILEEVKKRIVEKEKIEEIKRFYPEYTKGINEKQKEVAMEISMPIFMVGIKEELENNKSLSPKEIVTKHITMDIILNVILGQSSSLYQRLYNSGDIMSNLGFDYEFSEQYSHILISGSSKKPYNVYEEIQKEIERFIGSGIALEDFQRIKKKVYGEYVKEYNHVGSVARMFLADTLKGLNSLDYIDSFDDVNLEYANGLIKEILNKENMVISVVTSKNG